MGHVLRQKQNSDGLKLLIQTIPKATHGLSLPKPYGLFSAVARLPVRKCASRAARYLISSNDLVQRVFQKGDGGINIIQFVQSEEA